MEVDLAKFDNLMATFEEAVATSKTSALDRFQLFKEHDPFPSIPPALLNAGHLASYAVTAGMIDPFERRQLTKPATYLVSVEGECRYRDDDGKMVSFFLSKDPAERARHLDVRNKVRLAPNSVCFLTLLPEFRMPAYIGARFNLLIRDVYRGLLVGTGPLVDPGFTGRLSIPIHNFTNKEYFIDAGEGLVYFEFTKMTWSNSDSPPPIPTWVPTPIEAQPPFPASKANRRTLDDYLNAATGGGAPENAIGPKMKEMSNQIERAEGLLKFYTLAGLAAAVGLVFTTWSLYSGVQQFTAAAQTELRESHVRLSSELMILQAKQNDLERLIIAHQLTSTPPTANLPATLSGSSEDRSDRRKNLETSGTGAVPSGPATHLK